MKRRTLLRRIGATGIAATTFAGASTATTPTLDLGFDREIDVSDVSGRVTLAELVDEADLERLDDGVDPYRQEVLVSEDAATMAGDDCCPICCTIINIDDPTCPCYVCDDTIYSV